jgi:UDP-3-O-[3-hydroxymyristoyl] glucosamine N-acyltransferase
LTVAGWPGASTAGPFTVEELAQRLGGQVEGDGSLELVDVRGLGEAEPQHLSFLSNRRYYRQLRTSRAGAVLLDRTTDPHGHTVIRCDDPYADFARALALFHPQPWPEPGIDPRAAVAPDAEVEGVTVEAFSWVGAGARVGPGSWIQAGAYVGEGSVVGRDCRLMPHSVVMAGCTLGDRVWLNPGAVIGAEGFGFAPSAEGHVKIPQTGRAVLEDDVEVGANSCVDHATMGETVVRRGAKLDNLVQVGHGAEVGAMSFLAAYAGLAGSARIGTGVVMAAKTGVINHLSVGDGAQLAVGTHVFQDQPAGARLAGAPAIDHRRWLRVAAATTRLPDLVRRLQVLERRVAALAGGRGDEED